MMVDGQWCMMQGGATARQPVNVGVAPFPAPEANPRRANRALVQGPVLIVPAAAVDSNAVLPLLAWMMSPARLADAAYAHGLLPASRVAARDPRFHEARDFDVFLELLADPGTTSFSPMPDRVAYNSALVELEKAVLHKGAAVRPLVDEFQRSFALMREEALGYEQAP